MLSLEFVTACLAIMQPPIFGFLLFSLGRLGVGSKFFFSHLKSTRRRFKSVKFFECAVYSRLINQAQYDVVTLALCVLFILYDVDLIFFFTEAVCIGQWSSLEAYFVFANFLLLIFGVWYDYIRLGFN
jgi:NADH:ubiquinone oxidoreductase subunit 3 (subunit A)